MINHPKICTVWRMDITGKYQIKDGESLYLKIKH